MRARSGRPRKALRMSRFEHFAIVARNQSATLLLFRSRVWPRRLAVMSGIFFTVDRCHMRRVFIQIRSPDSEFLAVIIDPSPQAFTGNVSLRTCLAPYAHEIGRKPMTVAAA